MIRTGAGPRGRARTGHGGERRVAGIPEHRLVQLGVLAGAALGAGLAVAARHAERRAREGGLVDWEGVVALAHRRLEGAPGRLSAAELQAAEPAWAAAMARVVPALEAHLGTPLPGVVERVAVVDRRAWVDANVTAFAGLVGRLEADLVEQLVPRGGGGGRAAVALANRWVTTAQLGLLLGFLGRRVLGQYDVALLSAEAAPGRLLFVEENIRAQARALGVPLDAFRTWIALHETTHAWEFEAHPWLRPYLAERLEVQLAGLGRDARAVGRDAARGLRSLLRGRTRATGGHWMERLLPPEQRRAFRETQAVMSLLEGFGDHVMDAAGRGLVPDVARISARFHARREQRSAPERLALRLTGLDLKMEQYRRGEAFVAALDRAAGPAALRLLWTGPETLPTPEELARPAAWLARMGLGTGGER